MHAVPKYREDLFTAVEPYSQLSVFIPVLLTGILYQVQSSINALSSLTNAIHVALFSYSHISPALCKSLGALFHL